MRTPDPSFGAILQGRERMRPIVLGMIVIAASTMLADAQPAKRPYEPGLGEFMTATQLRHAKLWFAGKSNNWGLATYEIDEIKEGLEDAAKLHSTLDGFPVAEMIKTILDPRIAQLERAIEGKNSTQFIAAFGLRPCKRCRRSTRARELVIVRLEDKTKSRLHGSGVSKSPQLAV